MTTLYKETRSWLLAPVLTMTLHKQYHLLSTTYAAAFDPDHTHPFQDYCNEFVRDYIIEIRLRHQFKRLLNAYRVYKMNQKSTDRIDPITFNPIRDPIRVYSVPERRCYLFDPDSLNKSIRKNLYHSQYTIPEPKDPINVYTNRPFTFVQMISIFEQLRLTNQRIEDLSLYRTLQFQLRVWKRHMDRALRMTAIRDELQNLTSLDGQDMLADFIKDSMVATRFPLTERFEHILDNAIHWYPEHTLLGLLRTLCVKSYESSLFKIEIHEVLMMQFANLFQRNFPKCSLWDQVEDRLVADSAALKEQEQEQEQEQ